MVLKVEWIFGILLFLGLLSNTLAQNQVACWHFDETGGLIAKETVSDNNFTVRNDYPTQQGEWITGTSQNALRFNGYATWVEGILSQTMPSQGITISAWVAPEVYPYNTAAFFTNKSLAGGGVYLGIDRYGRLEIGCTVNTFSTVKTSFARIPHWEWSHVALTVDAVQGKLKGFINGVMVAEQNTLSGTLTWPSTNLIKIGKHHNSPLAGIFETGMFCGIIDEVNIYDTALSESALYSKYQNEMPAALPDMAVPAARFSGDIHRPIFHAIPPANWMNEPHGLILHNGLYHIFYQKNGNGPYWGRLNWGHQTSPDLITWTEEKVVLWPDPGSYDLEGCWSGASISKNDTAFIMYTGVDGGTAQMCLAQGDQNLGTYQKYAGNPVVAAPPAPFTGNDFRDPYVWQDNNHWYMIIGTGTGSSSGAGGAVLLYRSPDLKNWSYIGIMHQGFPSTDNSGIFWEVPMFLRLGSKYVLTAQPVPQAGMPSRILYWTGNFLNEVFVPDNNQPAILEPGDNLLGVTTTTDPEGRLVAMGIIPDILPASEQRLNGWAHLMSLPRIWSLSADGTALYQKPHPDLIKLRGENHHFDNLAAPAGQSVLQGIEGRHLEIRTSINPGTAERVGVVLAQSADNSEYTRVYWDVSGSAIRIDRSHSSINSSVPKGTVSTAFQSGPSIDLHIFLDGSVLEVFVDDKIALSTRIFPEKAGSVEVGILAESGSAALENLDIWEMKSMHDPSVSTSDAIPSIKKKLIIENLYPNPTDGVCWMDINLPEAAKLEIQISDLNGILYPKSSVAYYSEGRHHLCLPLKDLPNGMFFVRILTKDGILISKKIIKH